MGRLTKAMDKYLSDVTKVTEQQMVNSKLASKTLEVSVKRRFFKFFKAREGCEVWYRETCLSR